MVKLNLQIPVEISLSADPGESNFHKLQRDIRRESRRALVRGLQQALQEMEKALLTAPVLCPRCGRSAWTRSSNG